MQTGLHDTEWPQTHTNHLMCGCKGVSMTLNGLKHVQTIWCLDARESPWHSMAYQCLEHI